MSESKYENSKIYCLYCSDDYYYIGSTRNELRYRLGKHKVDSNSFPTRKVYDHINKLGWNNVKIQLLEDYPCETREELLKKENEYIRSCDGDPYCLNLKAAFQTAEELKLIQSEYRQKFHNSILAYKEQYRKENAEKIAEYNKKYVEENKDAVKERKRIYNQLNKEKVSKKCKEYNEAHKDVIAVQKKEWAEKHKEELQEKSKKFREENKEILNEKAKQYYEENKEACKARMRIYKETHKTELLEKAKQVREKKRLEGPETSILCTICQGTYLARHKKRHESSKLHQKFLENESVDVTTHI